MARARVAKKAVAAEAKMGKVANPEEIVKYHNTLAKKIEKQTSVVDEAKKALTQERGVLHKLETELRSACLDTPLFPVTE